MMFTAPSKKTPRRMGENGERGGQGSAAGSRVHISLFEENVAVKKPSMIK